MKLKDNCDRSFDYGLYDGCGLFTAHSLNKLGFVRHCFTSRVGGVSPAPFDTLNMGLRRPDKRENILENYRRVCDAMGFSYDTLTCVNYTHGPGVATATMADAGRGVYGEDFPFECDGITTNEKGLALVTVHADCLSMFFADPVNHTVGICHAGWRGVAQRIGTLTLENMRREYGTNPADGIAAVGPGIGQCCFEVDEPVADIFRREYPGADIMTQNGAKYNIDLYECCVAQLVDAGVKPENITVADACTMCDPEKRFFSARNSRDTGAMAGIIEIV